MKPPRRPASDQTSSLQFSQNSDDSAETSLEPRRGGRKDNRSLPSPIPKSKPFSPRWLRIVAGQMRGRKVQYSGDPSIRPMKDRTRESVFNLLGGDLSGYLAIDLFAGTGVMGIESISRGAERAIMLELSRPAVSTIVDNAKQLKVDHLVEVHNVDTLRWLKYVESTSAAWQKLPWVVFCCPPYKMWTTEGERIKEGLLKLYQLSAPESMFVVECELEFDILELMPEFEWDVRTYKPATIAIASRS